MSNKFVLEIRPFGNKCDRYCKHCYQSKKVIHNPLNLQRLEKFAKKLNKYLLENNFSTIKIVFHGGEPLIDNGEWVSDSINIFNSNLDPKITYCCHTHGFHAESVFNNLIKKEVRFGISLDLYNDYKIKSVMIPDSIFLTAKMNSLSSIQMVIQDQEIDFSSFGALLHRLPEGTNIKFIPCFSLTDTNFKISPNQYLNNIEDIYQYLLLTDFFSKFFIEPVSWIHFSKSKFRGCRFDQTCSLKSKKINSIAIDNDELIYICNRFAAINKFPLANINDDKWEEGCSQKMEQISKELNVDNLMKKCEKCTLHINEICQGTGGCPFHELICENSSDNTYCIAEENLYNISSKNKKMGIYDLIFN